MEEERDLNPKLGIATLAFGDEAGEEHLSHTELAPAVGSNSSVGENWMKTKQWWDKHHAAIAPCNSGF